MPRIGEYELKETLASGAFAKVKLAIHCPTNIMYAAKIIPKTNRDVEKDIRTEIGVMRRLNHDNVVRLNEILESQNNYYIILEPALGGDLCSKVMANPNGLSEEECVRILFEILNGLKACHQNKVAHRDLKPENILFTDTGKVKITDFGLSRLHHTCANEANSAELANTLTGTPQYVAPEVLRGRYDAFKADLWSLGCIMYVMLTSRFPFGSANGKELERRILAGTYDPLRETIVKDARDLVAALLKVDPKERLPLDQIASHPFLVRHMTDEMKAQLATTTQLQPATGADFSPVDQEEDVSSPTQGKPSSSPARSRRKMPGT
eukprot:Tbor_TRINITY_DN4987_c8_g5::TRINITY_DN4987_c8_g5_i1::g.9821::m.9821